MRWMPPGHRSALAGRPTRTPAHFGRRSSGDGGASVQRATSLPPATAVEFADLPCSGGGPPVRAVRRRHRRFRCADRSGSFTVIAPSREAWRSRTMTDMPFTMEDIRRTGAKKRDAWWTVFVVDPVAAPIALFIANRTRITPNQITVASFVLGLGAAVSFAFADYPALVLGAVLYPLSFVLDCVDGKVARLKGTGSIFGGWLDYILDRVRVFVCAVALMGGQFVKTGRPIYLYLAVFVVFLEMLRNLNALRVN